MTNYEKLNESLYMEAAIQQLYITVMDCIALQSWFDVVVNTVFHRAK